MEGASAVLRAFPFGVPKSRPRQAQRAKSAEGAAVSAAKPGTGSVLAVSRAMTEVLSVVGRLAPTDVTVTLTGETGTGKDVFAHMVHDMSQRASRPFVVFDCGAVPANLVESELFGHEKGAFTGAHAEHLGRVRAGSGRNALPGRDRRAAAGPAAAPAPRAGQSRHQARRRHVRPARRRPHRRRDQPGSGRAGFREAVSSGSRISGWRRRSCSCRHCANGWMICPCSSRRLLSDLGRDDLIVPETTIAALRGAQLAGKHPRAQERARVRAGVRRRRARPSRATCASSPRRRRTTALDRLPLGGHSLVALERAAIRQTLLTARGNKVHAAKALGIAPSTLYEKLKKYGL